MPRISDCDYQPGGCNDPRCKRGLCVREKVAVERSAVADGVEALELRDQAKAVVVAIYEARGRGKPTESQVSRLILHPEIKRLARERLDGIRRLGPVKIDF